MLNNWFHQSKIAQISLDNILLNLHNNKIDNRKAFNQIKSINFDVSVFCDQIAAFAQNYNSQSVRALYNSMGCNLDNAKKEPIYPDPIQSAEPTSQEDAQ